MCEIINAEATEMSAVEYIREYRRMHHFYFGKPATDGGMNGCGDCPGRLNGKKNCIFSPTRDESSVPIVEKWAQEHREESEHPAPKRKTYAEDFLEKFPNSYTVKKTDENPYPLICRQVVYQGSRECPQIRAWYFSDDMCSNCWNKEMEEQDG